MSVLVQIVWHDQKPHIALHFDHLDLRYAMVPLMMLSASHYWDTIAVASHNTDGSGIMWFDVGGSGITWQKYHDAPHFSFVDLWNAMTPSASNDASAVANGVAIKSCCTSFWSSGPMECSGITLDHCKWHCVMQILVPMASHDQKNHVSHHFNCLNIS